MCRRLIHLTVFIVALGFICEAWAAGADVEIHSPNEPPPVIDGLIDEVWSLSTQQFITISIGEGPPDSAEDCSGSWWALYDSEYLYLLVDVNDEALVQDSDATQGWHDDRIEVFLDGDNSKDSSPDGENDYQYNFRWNHGVVETPVEWYLSPGSLEGVEYAVVTTDSGYLFEIKLPWSTMIAGPAQAGQLIGIDVMIDDDDDGGNRDTQMAWYLTSGDPHVPSMWGTGWLVPGLKASSPEPADGAENVNSPLLRWTVGRTAAYHDVYLGTDEVAVTNATSSDPMGPVEVYKVRYGHAMWWELAPWIPGATYYWRIDEVEADGTTIHTGDLWSFTTAPLEAYDPDPRDGAKWVGLNPTLTWFPGADAIKHDVYFGTDETEVANGTGSTFKGNQAETLYAPGTLLEDTTYYWRIDGEDLAGTTKYPGNVWRFTTIGPDVGLRGYYYHWFDGITRAGGDPGPADPFQTFVMSRADRQINFQFANSPEPGVVNDDNFSARWVGEIEAEFTETYRFYTATDDGARLWVNDQLIIDQWIDQGTTEVSGTIDLVAGVRYPIVMEYYENGGGAVAELRWSSPSTPYQIIPAGPLQLPLRASTPDPPNGAAGVKDTPTLTWKVGERAAQHYVFFGTDQDAVANADTTTVGIYRGAQSLENTSYLPTEVPLEWEQTYYWKVNEVNGVDLWEGSVWSFTVANYLIIDDFEDYNDYCDRIFYTWGDGWGHNGDAACGVPPSSGNGTGSTVGYLQEPYAEQTITHDGSFQSMPFEYLNDGSNGKALYSETERTFDPPQDWTSHDVKALTLFFRGYPASVGGFSYDSVTDTYTVTADGWDISGTADGFHYVFKRLSGVGSIQAQVLGLTNTNEWAKAGVMIREDLDPNSAHAITFITPGQGVVFEYRPSKGADNVGAAGQDTAVAAPHWVKIGRSGNSFTAEHSADGTTWQTLGTPQNIPMASTVYVGLALTSHTAGVRCTATFSDVTTDGTVTGQWQSQDIGIASNDAEQLYVALEDSTGMVENVPHPDPNAAQLNTWQEWNIDLAEFAPVDLTKVKKMYIGVGDRDAPKLGGDGMLYIDDIRLYRPRCLPSVLKPGADFSGNCVVDYADLEIMANEWLGSGTELQADLDTDNDVDFKDFALLAEDWLSKLLWPQP